MARGFCPRMAGASVVFPPGWEGNDTPCSMCGVVDHNTEVAPRVAWAPPVESRTLLDVDVQIPTEEWLTEVEAWIRAHQGVWAREHCGVDTLKSVALRLIAEHRRLRRENRILHLSRGSAPDTLVGGD